MYSWDGQLSVLPYNTKQKKKCSFILSNNKLLINMSVILGRHFLFIIQIDNQYLLANHQHYEVFVSNSCGVILRIFLNAV